MTTSPDPESTTPSASPTASTDQDAHPHDDGTPHAPGDGPGHLLGVGRDGHVVVRSSACSSRDGRAVA